MDTHSDIAVRPSNAPEALLAAPSIVHARFSVGDIVRHRLLDFRGVVFDIDPVFANTEEWYQAIPETIRPAKDQPFYHLLAENAESSYVAYVSQQNLVADHSEEPVEHPALEGLFDGFTEGRYTLRREHRH
ncbi:heat shock protein HspQ [Sphingomonas sp. PR090111-T3T-6A]|uniref:heat shock protein HspQ n=1 Tax=Sphingomonas sp. PR090111-T3T-6A TaxID=685778 RepID=UPI0003747E93|nr:heat shock protein HspQ [Sphingomonas sp. PR090111-T3T-6A]